MKYFLMTTAALAAFCASPITVASSGDFNSMILMAKAEAGNGNGNMGNGGGNAGRGGNSDHGNTNGSGKSLGNQADPDDASSDDDQLSNPTQPDGKSIKGEATRESNLHAVLGRINSVGRNVNGLIGSNDPHLSGLRTYVLNSVQLAKAQTEADSARASYDAALANYTALGLTGDPATTLSQLSSAIASADPAMTSDLYAQIDATKALLAASNNLVASDAHVAQYSVLASDAALLDALTSMSNRKLRRDDFSSETIEWTKAVLGIGDATGAIDAYMAQ